MKMIKGRCAGQHLVGREGSGTWT